MRLLDVWGAKFSQSRQVRNAAHWCARTDSERFGSPMVQTDDAPMSQVLRKMGAFDSGMDAPKLGEDPQPQSISCEPSFACLNQIFNELIADDAAIGKHV